MADAFPDSYQGQSTEKLLPLEGRYRNDSLVLGFEEAIQANLASRSLPGNRTCGP